MAQHEMRGAGGGGFGHAPAAADAPSREGLKTLGDFLGSGAPPDGSGVARRNPARRCQGGVEGDPHGGDAGEIGGAFDLDVVQHGLRHRSAGGGARCAALHLPEQQHDQAVDVEEGQHGDDALLGLRAVALRAVELVVDGDAARSLAWVWIAAFGRPVVPPVYCRTASASGWSSGQALGLGAVSRSPRLMRPGRSSGIGWAR